MTEQHFNNRIAKIGVLPIDSYKQALDRLYVAESIDLGAIEDDLLSFMIALNDTLRSFGNYGYVEWLEQGEHFTDGWHLGIWVDQFTRMTVERLAAYYGVASFDWEWYVWSVKQPLILVHFWLTAREIQPPGKAKRGVGDGD